MQNVADWSSLLFLCLKFTAEIIHTTPQPHTNDEQE